MITVPCPTCHKNFNAPDEYIGRKAKCPSCGNILLIGGKQSSPLPPQPMPELISAQPNDSCANCGRKFGKLEQPLFYKNNLVCASCHNLLTANETMARPQQGTVQLSRSTSKFICGTLGAVLLAIGAFLPLVSVPIIGSLNYVRNGTGDGIVILFLAGTTIVCTLKKCFEILYLTASGAAALLIYTLVNLYRIMHGAKQSVGTDLIGNPFRDLAETVVNAVQLEYGWIVLAIGIVCTFLAAGIDDENKGTDDEYRSEVDSFLKTPDEPDIPTERMESPLNVRSAQIVFTVVIALFFAFIIFYAWFISRKH